VLNGNEKNGKMKFPETVIVFDQTSNVKLRVELFWLFYCVLVLVKLPG
jgi:hypothetical protein